jgi:RNA polymerase sigma factor (sigma-70 family)
MNNIISFTNNELGTIRTVLIDNEPYFVGKDVAKALGYTNPQKAIKDHVDEEDRTVNESFTVNGTQGLLINESGLYSLILSSKLPNAKKFKRWVTSEVIPSIRKYGGYIANQDNLTDEELLANAVQIAQRKIEERDKQIILLRFYKDKTQTEVAKILGISQVQVSRIEKRILAGMKTELVS